MNPRVWISIGLLLVLSAALFYAPVDHDYLAGETGKRLWTQIEPKIKSVLAPEDKVHFTAVKENALIESVVALGAASVGNVPDSDKRLLVSVDKFWFHQNLQVLWQIYDGKEWVPKHIFTSKVIRVGWWSVVPALLVVFMALLFGRMIIALLSGIVLGATLLANGNPFFGIWNGITEHTIYPLFDEFHILLIVFAISIMALTSLVSRMGGMHGLVGLVTRFARSARSSQLMTMFSGVLLFFDDYASCLVVGPTARALTDKMKVSRAKLAFIIDSTAAPVACTAIISTWIAYELGLIQDLLTFLGVEGGAYELFLQSIPYRFYSLMMLGFVLLVSITGRDFGPMHRAEVEARRGAGGGDKGDFVKQESYNVKPGIPHRWFNGAIPIAALIVITIAGFIITGGGNALFTGELEWSLKSIAGIFSAASTSRVLVLATLVSIIIALTLAFSQHLLTIEEAGRTIWKSIRMVIIPLLIWILAWGIGHICKDLSTSYYLVALLRDHISPAVLTLCIFLIGAGISFVTGTSWGSMAILIPTTLPLTYELGGMPLLIISLGAVLDGSIFGDHCSPVSDTTIMSSLASSCDHLTHVKTQMPYAVLVMVTAALLGYLLAPQGVAPWVSIPLGVTVLFIVLRLFGKTVEEVPSDLEPARVVIPVEEVPAAT